MTNKVRSVDSYNEEEKALYYYIQRENERDVKLYFLHYRGSGEVVYVDISLIEKKVIRSEEHLHWALFDIDQMKVIDEPVKLKKENDKYQIVNGIHRIFACEILKYKEIPAILV